MRSSIVPRRVPGFTLTELLISVSLGAMLLIATAHSAGMFGLNLASVTQDRDEELEEIIEQIRHEVRYASWVRLVNDRTLMVADALGRETMYHFVRPELTRVLPDGTGGLLSDELSRVVFTADTVQRLREGTPVTRDATFWTGATPVVAPAVMTLSPGESVAMGFTVSSIAPFTTTTVEGVTEQLVAATLRRLELPLARVAGQGDLQISIYRARYPGDSQPHGLPVATTTLSNLVLPMADVTFLHTQNGNPMNPPPHGVWNWWQFNPNVEMTIHGAPNMSQVDISTLPSDITPGTAYTIVLKVTGQTMMALAAYPTGTGSGTPITFHDGQTSGWTELPSTMVWSLAGDASVTTTEVHDTVSRVHVLMRSLDDLRVQGSAAVLGQVAATEPWLGTVAGTPPPLLGGGP